MTAAPCDHAGAVPVESAVTGETLAALCPDCDAQLPAQLLGCPHLDTIDITSMDEPPGRHICNGCGTTGWYGSHNLISLLIDGGFDAASVAEAAPRLIPSITNVNSTPRQVRELRARFLASTHNIEPVI